MSAVIRLNNLAKTYRMGETEVQALRDVSFDVASGEFVAVMGPSGSGKSTLMNIIGCLDRPTSGSYELESIDVSTLNRDRRAEIRNDKIGFVFQNFNLLPRTSALENVELPLIYSNKHKFDSEGMRDRAMQCLARVGLHGWEHHTSSQLSGGQQQRVAIARALVNQPSIILADEPTGNLDSHTSQQVMQVFQSLNAEGICVVLITHEHDIAAYSHRIITMKDGLVLTDELVSSTQAIEEATAR